MSTWRVLPMRRRVAVVLMALFVVAVGVQMYALAERAAEPTTVADIDVVADAESAEASVGGPAQPSATVNEFLPEDRNLGDCISAIPKPGCGSEARGGWHQTLVFLAIMFGLAVIVWRIVAGARKAKASQNRRVGTGH